MKEPRSPRDAVRQVEVSLEELCELVLAAERRAALRLLRLLYEDPWARAEEPLEGGGRQRLSRTV